MHDQRGGLLPGRLNQPIDATGQDPVAFVGGVLVARCRVLRRVTKPAHDPFGPGTGRGGQRPRHVSQVV